MSIGKQSTTMNRRNVLIGAGALALTGAALTYSEIQRMGSIQDYAAAVALTRRTLSARPEIHDLIRYATLAPNGHNTQPWRFRVQEDRITILPDWARRTPVVDPDDHHVFVSLGAAAENLLIASCARGRPGTIRFDGTGDGSVVFSFGEGSAPEPALFGAITRRQSTRSEYDGRSVTAADLQSLANAALMPDVDLILITDRTQMDRVRDLVVDGNAVQLGDPAFMRELKSWIRFNPHDALTTGDGLFSVASGNPALPDWLGPGLLSLVLKPDTDNEKYTRQIRSSAGLALFSGAQEDKAHWVQVGRACQRFSLQATALGMKMAYVNQPSEVVALRPELAALAGIPGRRPDILMRFGYAEAMPFSARRPVDSVLV